MTRLIDLSYSYTPDVTTSIRLGSEEKRPRIEYRLITTHEEHGRTNAIFSCSVHMGTHLDPPYHMFPEGPTIDEMPLERFYVPGFIFKLQGKVPERTAVRVDQLLEAADVPDGALRGRFVIVNTGWAAQAYKTERYYAGAPWLSSEAAQWLVEQGAGIVGFDNPPDQLTFDPAIGMLSPGESPVHKTLLGGGTMIAENLANLDQVSGQRSFVVAAFPLKIHRGCGGPARIVAIED